MLLRDHFSRCSKRTSVVCALLCEVQQVCVSEAMLSEVRNNVLTALNVSKDGRIELAEFARSVTMFGHLIRVSI